MINIKTKILKEIQTQKEVYKKSSSIMISAFNREIETEKEYNGRQLLELLQNADDEQSDEVQIKLDTKKNVLTIANRGGNCSPFTYEGIRSLMISNLSSKTNKKFIGNKGLGFRSIINWSEKITINSNGLDIIFARNIVDNIFDELFTLDEQENIQNNSKYKNTKSIPFLAIPSISEKEDSEWTTSITVQYKNEYLNDIKKQINELKDEILLFLNSIKKLVVIVDNEMQLEIEKETLSKKWKIFQKRDKLPNSLWDNEDEEEYFDLKIALQNNLENDIKELFSYFPTKIDINLPFIVHGTFELNSSRNEINDSSKNRYILKQLVELIVSTAKSITKEEVSYKALEMLSYKTPHKILKELGFYKAIDNAIEELEVFPCLDGRYRILKDITYIDDLSVFAKRTHNESLFENLLIPIENYISINSYSLNTSIDSEKLNRLSKNIEDINDRADLIYMFYHTFKHEEKLLFLIDKDKELISLNDDVYTPSKYDFSIPSFVKIKFIHKELFDKLILKFNIISNEKSRDLQRKLKEITNIQSYEPAPVLQKIVTSTKKELERNIGNHIKIIKDMVHSLYKNYVQLDKTRIPTDTKIQLLNKNNLLSDARNLFLSKSYPSGQLTELLFEDIFTDDNFLADVSIYDFRNKDMEDIEAFFLWLGVNKHTKFQLKTQDTSYTNFVFKYIQKPINYRDCSLQLKVIADFENIIQKLSLEKIILWFSLDEKINMQLDNNNSDVFRYSKDREYYGNFSHAIHQKPSYILYQILSMHIFDDYLIGSDKLNSLINNISFDFNYQEFKTYQINKSDIESLLLKIGAIDKFEKLSIGAINRIVKELPIKSPEGKQAQSIYKLCIKHFEQNKTPLNNDDNILLFAKKGGEKKYFNKDSVFYSGVKLPNKITNSKAVLDYPGRLNETNIISFFSINNLKSINISIVELIVSQSITKEFNELFRQIEEYILVYRIKESPADTSAYEALRRLKNLNIALCNKVKYKIDDEDFELDDNDYIKYGNEYLIKINIHKSLDEIIKGKLGFDFQESFADIIGLVFDIQDTKVFREMIKEDTAYIEKTIRNDIGSDELIRARELLGKTDELLSFWKTIYTLINKDYIFSSDENLFNLILADLNITTQIDKIDYKHLNTFQSCIYIKQLFDELGLEIKDFNESDSFYKIDFNEYHITNIKQAFDSYNIIFQKRLYTYCIAENREKHFNDDKALYNHNEVYIDEQAIVNRFIKTVSYDDIVKSFINKTFNLENIEPTNIDFKSNYDKNILQIDVDELNGKAEYISLLYFDDMLEVIQKYIDSLNTNIESKSDEEVFHIENEIGSKQIVDIDLLEPISIKVGKPHRRKPYKHSPEIDKQKKANGNKAEEDVYVSLVLEYGQDNVEHVSNDDDSLGYDIKYKNSEGIFKYVEVKTYSGGQFNLSRNEKEFAQKHLGFYEVFLVGDNIFRIPFVDYSDETKFTLINSEFIVKYNIL